MALTPEEAKLPDVHVAMHDFGLRDGYTRDDVKRTYRRLITKYHPDRAKDESDRARRTDRVSIINNEYSVLIHSLDDIDDATTAATTGTTERMHVVRDAYNPYNHVPHDAATADTSNGSSANVANVKSGDKPRVRKAPESKVGNAIRRWTTPVREFASENMTWAFDDDSNVMSIVIIVLLCALFGIGVIMCANGNASDGATAIIAAIIGCIIPMIPVFIVTMVCFVATLATLGTAWVIATLLDGIALIFDYASPMTDSTSS